MSGRLRIQAEKNPGVIVTRDALKAAKTVYIGCSNRPWKYPGGESGRWSRILYIGQTIRGVARVMESAADKAASQLLEWGNRELRFYLVHCRGVQRVKTWKQLEMALVLAFRECYGAPPKFNDKGKRRTWGNLLNYYRKERLLRVIAQYT